MSADDRKTPDTVNRRTPEQIEAEILRTRSQLTDTVNELSDRLDPRAQIDTAKEVATEKARTFADDVRRRDPKALATLGASVAAAALLIVLKARRR